MLANDLADAYVMADKYQLNLLKADLVHMFRHRELDGCGMGGISHDNDALLSAIQRIYGSVPGTNQEFRTYFKEVAPSFLLRANNFESINDCLDDNVFYGLLGRDLFEAAMEALKLEAKHRAKAMDNSRNKRAKGIRRSE